MNWSGGLIDWERENIVYISVVFSWQVQKAYSKAVWYKEQGKTVEIGGPAIAINGNIFDGIAKVGGSIEDVVSRHNSYATFTSKGCTRKCPFCVVSKVEGELIELKDWPIRPIICDNNLLATSYKHFNSVIDKLKPLKEIDFNQGLDARLLTTHHADRLRELDTLNIRLAWDNIAMEKSFMRAWERLLNAGFPKSHIRSYVLIGFNDTPEDALYRLQTIKDMGGTPNPMRYQPLNTQKRNSYIHPNWTDRQLKDFMKYWSRQIWLRPVPFEEYQMGKKRNNIPTQDKLF